MEVGGSTTAIPNDPENRVISGYNKANFGNKGVDHGKEEQDVFQPTAQHSLATGHFGIYRSSGDPIDDSLVGC